ncbi:MAG: hypothetical protein LCH63_15420 [Candidatus Melainabacteria bacterium]|jgi:hypothetical protein|nr:hypothetical protein [Candidatus Melainabacteria bacterium]
MGKSFRDRYDAVECDAKSFRKTGKVKAAENCIYVNLADVYMSDAAVEKLLARDGQQIEAYRQAYENGEDMVRVVLRPRFGGGYNVEDGRHRVIAAKQAGVGFIEALIVG